MKLGPDRATWVMLAILAAIIFLEWLAITRINVWKGDVAMDRTQAVEIARKCARAKPQSYYSEPFEPHEWVVDAILEASLGSCAEVPKERNKRAYCEACGYPDRHDPNCPMPQPICVEVFCQTPVDCRRAGICQWEEEDRAQKEDHNETLARFFAKYALGPKMPPSCLVCGRVSPWPPAIQHAELPGIVVCHSCRDAAARERD